MTQPIDVAYVEVVAQTKDFRKQLKDEVQKELKETEKVATSTGDGIEAAFKKAGDSANKTFRDVNGRLRDANGRLVQMGEAGVEAFEEVGKAAGKAAAGGANALLSILLGMTGTIGQLAALGPIGLAILAAAFIALAGVVAVAAAAVQNLVIIAGAGLAVLPGLVAQAIAGFGILAVAINGVSEAFKEESEASSKAAGVSVDNSRRIADAQRGVLQAQKDLIKAREEERERIQDVNRELLAARTAEKRATLNVLDAEFALEQARKRGETRNIKEAELRLEEANASLAEQKDRTEDLATEKAKADKNGVEGSERVQRALEALRDAQDGLAAAQQKFGAGAASAGRAIDKLSASAQAFVRAIIAAKKELAPLATRIQEAFFSGTAELVPPIVENIKELEPDILRVADAFNGIFTEILKFFGSDEAKEGFSGVLGGLATILEEITPAITPLLEAFASLAGDSEDVSKSIGQGLAGALIKFADFLKTVDLKKLFDDAKVAIEELLPLVQPSIAIFLSLFRIIASIGQVALPFIATALKDVEVVLGFFEENIVPVFKAVEDFIKLIREDPAKAFEIFKQAVKKTIDDALNAFDDLLVGVSNVIDDVQKFLGDLPKNIGKLGPKMLEAGKKLIKAFFDGLSEAGGFLADVGKRISNSVIRFLNRSVIGELNDVLNVIEERLNKLPLFDVDLPNIPNIPELATGGLITKDSLFRGGERGKEEAVLPLTNTAAMSKIANAISEAGGGLGGPAVTFGPGSVVVTFEGAVPTQAEAFQAGHAVGRGITAALEKKNVTLAVRTL